MAQCNGHKPNGDRCGRSWGLDDLGYCWDHDWQGLPRCQGFRLVTKELCMNPAKPDYDYCCAAHDPTKPYVSPNVLNPIDFNLRREVKRDVVARYDGKDGYNCEQLDLAALDLDHIVEKQCFTFVLYKMELLPEGERWLLATDVLRESVVNEVDNLMPTRSSTNRIKGRGVWKYLDDQRTGHLDKTFTGYLLDARRDGRYLERDVTRCITHYMGKSIKICQRQLANEGETPVLEQLSEQLQQLYVDMELHGARKNTVK